jgi:cephalosporin-C deacetylase
VPLTDMSLDELRAYRPEIAEPEDFDAFWAETLAEVRSHPLAPSWTPVTDTFLSTVDVFDVRFAGWAGQPVAGWLILPRGAEGPLPAVVEFIGYSGGRGLPEERLLYASAGYAHLVVDSRGQGHATPDRTEGQGGQWVGGFMTRGIEDPRHYYYRRLMSDCVRAVEAAREHPMVDPDRVVVAGGSQGGGLSIAVAGLAPELVAAALPDVPFLCHFRRAVEIASEDPYPEIAEYLRRHSRNRVEETFRTLSYFDGANFAARATAPALFSVGLMDPICPPSTVYAAYHRWKGEAGIEVWPFADHGGGYADQSRRRLAWLHARGLAAR